MPSILKEPTDYTALDSTVVSAGGAKRVSWSPSVKGSSAKQTKDGAQSSSKLTSVGLRVMDAQDERLFTDFMCRNVQYYGFVIFGAMTVLTALLFLKFVVSRNTASYTFDLCGFLLMASMTVMGGVPLLLSRRNIWIV